LLFAQAKEIKEAPPRHRPDSPEENLEGAPTAKLLPENQREPIPSVTERTTELLLAERKSSTKGN
jgi:hypothetical protein